MCQSVRKSYRSLVQNHRASPFQGVPVKNETNAIFSMHCHCSPEQQGALWNGYEILTNNWYSFDHQNQLIHITLKFFWGILVYVYEYVFVYLMFEWHKNTIIHVVFLHGVSSSFCSKKYSWIRFQWNSRHHISAIEPLFDLILIITLFDLILIITTLFGVSISCNLLHQIF